MTSDDQIRDEKLQYHINREIKLVSMNILLAKKNYLLIKNIKLKQIKTIEDQGEKQIQV